MTTPRVRVYDSDFTTDSNELINLAAEIALSYNGNWDGMCAWKAHCQTAQPLTIQDARTILNMSLSDSMQYFDDQIRMHLRTRFRETYEPSTHPRPAKPRLTVVRDRPEHRRTRWFLDTHVKVHSGLFRPRGIHAKVHFVDQHRSHLRWEVPGSHIEGNDALKEPTELYLYGWCGKSYKNVTIVEEEPTEADTCRLCLKTKREDGFPPSGRINFRGQTYARYWRPES